MNSRSRIHVLFLTAVTGVIALAARTAHAQAFYLVSKSQNFFQNSSGAPSADPSTPFDFSVQAATAITFTLPAGGTVPVPFAAGNQDFEIDQSYATKAAMDAAFPGGTYRMSGTGVNLSFNLTTDTYPTVTPQVTNGTWSPGGFLVIDPAQTTTINFNTFTGYATAGLAGHMQIRVQGQSNNSNVRLQNEIITTANSFGLTVSATPLTSITIPAGTLTNGQIYQGEVDFQTITTLDVTSVSGGAGVALFSKSLSFNIAAQAAGTTTPPPVIIAQPANQVGIAGGTATFNLGVTVGGSSNIGNLSVTWFFNGQPINLDGNKYASSNTGFGLTVRNLTATDAGNYSVTLANVGGVVSSVPATLTIAVASAPTITRPPASVTVAQGSTAVLSVAATGTPAPTYQWKLNNVNVTNLAGANGPTLSIPGASPAQAGSYTVVISNGVGNPVTSAPVTLAVSSNVTDPGRLINLSILTPLASGETMTMGTVLGGAGTSGNKPLLARAAGPSLAAFGITTFLPNPAMTLNFTTPTPAVVVATNTGWGGSATLSNTFASVGAFAFAGTTSKDSAIFQQSLQPGKYTVEVSDAGAGTGTVIAELYDATAAGSFLANTPRLINVSVLKQFATGSSLTAGFVIGGSAAKTVLIRAIGPGLASVGVTSGTMVDPQLTLNNTSASPAVVVATNNNWGGDPAISATASRVGAFAVNNGASNDAMLLVTLAPGNYTADVSPVSGTAGGTAIVEVYEVP